jgi:hypothetical protein
MKYRVLYLLGLACILAACGRGPSSDQPPPVKSRAKVATAVVVQPTVRSLPSNNANSAKPATTNAKTINVKAEL